MISDTLSDAVSEIERYLREYPGYESRDEIAVVVSAMDRLRAKLDALFAFRSPAHDRINDTGVRIEALFEQVKAMLDKTMGKILALAPTEQQEEALCHDANQAAATANGEVAELPRPMPICRRCESNDQVTRRLFEKGEVALWCNRCVGYLECDGELQYQPPSDGKATEVMERLG